MESNYLELAKSWANNPFFSHDSRQEIQDLINSNNLKELEERFYKDLEFGTGGMRSILGQGKNRINQYTIAKASYAVVLAVKDSLASSSDSSAKTSRPKIAISYDSRNMSFEFAKVSACVFAANGIQALIYKTLNPVALVSFATRFHQCSAAVMVTASHNPPEYNGYKVFWNDGKQVTPPHDQNIIKHFNQLEDISKIPNMDFEQAVKEEKIKWIGIETEDQYYQKIHQEFVNKKMCKDNGEQLKVVYTAIHGAGSEPCNRVLKELGFTNVFEVEQQRLPDGDFPTVKSPNPENPDALKLAVDLLNQKNADIALGTDPDTDRVGIALKNQAGEIVYLNGNQIGLLMLHYILKEKTANHSLPKNAYFVKTIVTTPLQEVIAKDYNVDCENTLTGFKWICQKLNEIEKDQPERNFIFGTEESFGYLNHEYARDKDGVSSIGLISEIALYYKLQNKTLLDALDDIYSEYGYFVESLLCLDYLGKEGSAKINRIMKHYRNSFNQELFNFEVIKKADYQLGSVINFKTSKSSTIHLPKSNVLAYHLSDGSQIFLRPSGTEPKIKFYIMLQETQGSLEQKKQKALLKQEQITNLIKQSVENI